MLRATTSFSFLNISVSYAIRYILVKVLIVFSPFAILSLASQKTSWFFKTWFKSFLALLFLQIFLAGLLLVSLVIESKNNNFLPTQVLHMGMIYALFKANSFVKEFIGGFTTDVSINFSNLFKGGFLK